MPRRGWKEFDAPAVRVDTFLRTAECFKGMTVAHPAFGKRRVFAQQDLVGLDCFRIFADPHQSRGTQGAVARIFRILFHEQVDLLDRLR